LNQISSYRSLRRLSAPHARGGIGAGRERCQAAHRGHTAANRAYCRPVTGATARQIPAGTMPLSGYARTRTRDEYALSPVGYARTRTRDEYALSPAGIQPVTTLLNTISLVLLSQRPAGTCTDMFLDTSSHCSGRLRCRATVAGAGEEVVPQLQHLQIGKITMPAGTPPFRRLHIMLSRYRLVSCANSGGIVAVSILSERST
jgi:hypothetical protein